ncbi:hypothetical protein ACHWQZ_G008675 [Mnemiopsis leidyi]
MADIDVQRAERRRRVFTEQESRRNRKQEVYDAIHAVSIKQDNLQIIREPIVCNEEAMDWEPTEPDFDDNDDPDMCGEYCKEIFRNEKKREDTWVLSTRLSDKKTKLRVSCIDWLTEVCTTWKLATDTLFVAVLYLEKALSSLDYTLDDMQAISGTCLFLAAKMEEVQAIPIRDIVEIAPGTSVPIIKAYEKQILTALNYQMVTPHLMLFVRRFNSIAGADLETHNLSKYLATLVLRHQGHCSGLQSVLGAAVCFMARRIMGKTELEAWPIRQTTYSYTLEEIKTAVYFVSHTLSNANRHAELHRNNPNKLPTAYNVFNQRKFHHISSKPIMRQTFVETYSLLNTLAVEST